MKAIIVFAERNYLNGCFKVAIDWPYASLPQKGDIFARSIYDEMVDWNSVSMDDILKLVRDNNVRLSWSGAYDSLTGCHVPHEKA